MKRDIEARKRGHVHRCTPEQQSLNVPPQGGGAAALLEERRSGVSLIQPLPLTPEHLYLKTIFCLCQAFAVEPGKVANLLLLRADPLAGVEAWNEIETVILHGELIPRESLAVPLSGSATRR
jgi:hypothetical protein